jgi:tetratricopeptide (TPR) repeat protein
MKLKITLMALGFLAALHAGAQTPAPNKQHYLDVYKRAIKYNDGRTAIVALNSYLALGEDAAYKDTLSLLYYLSGDYYPSLLLSQEIFEASPKNEGALERIANCYTQLGDVKSAVENYEKLCPMTKNPYHYYQLASAQYQIGRMEECKGSLQRVIADTSSKRVPVSFDNGEGQRPQTISILAGAYNMLAVMQMNNKNYESAKQMLNKAIEAFPDFYGAKQNLAVVEKLMKGGGKAPGGGGKPKGKG